MTVWNFTGAHPMDPLPMHVPAGEYHVEVARARETEAKSSGRPMVVVVFHIAEGAQQGIPLVERFVIAQSPSDSQVGIQRLTRLVDALGMPFAAGRQDFEASTLIG